MPVYNITTNENDKKTNIIMTIKDGWGDTIKGLIRITKDQKILLDWLIDNDYISDDYTFTEGSPDVEDLTIEKQEGKQCILK